MNPLKALRSGKLNHLRIFVDDPLQNNDQAASFIPGETAPVPKLKKSTKDQDINRTDEL
jgi:hypothetical protein